MRLIRWLALLPAIGMLAGPFLDGGVRPFILSLPFLLGWIVICVVLSAAVMAVIYYAERSGHGR